VRRLALFGACVALTAALGAASAQAAATADECRGLLVCLPVPGPWVVIPPGGAPARTAFELRCPLRGYIVAGTDVRLSDREIDVAFRGETGSPVAPGVTTSRAVLFTGTYVGTRRRAVTFRPFLGCVPTSGGGGRDQTSVAPPSGLRPTRPLERRVVTRRLQSGTRIQVVARCRRGERLIEGAHAVGFDTGNVAPGQTLLGAVDVVRRIRGAAVVATATADASLPQSLRVVAQVQALCRKASL
jgi:hypothetical protein